MSEKPSNVANLSIGLKSALAGAFVIANLLGSYKLSEYRVDQATAKVKDNAAKLISFEQRLTTMQIEAARAHERELAIKATLSGMAVDLKTVTNYIMRAAQ